MTERPHKMGSRRREGIDDDLALFHDMRRRERMNFLCPLKDDMDCASSPKHDGLSAFNALASAPTRNGHDLLNMDTDKNDYDWLLTPPTTPLFPSLDQDVQIVNLSQRRVLTRSTSVSKLARLSYPQEPSLRTQGGNPSPRRPSTASSTSSSITTSSNRGRPSSPSLTSRSSPTVRSSSPCRPGTAMARNPPPLSNRTISRSSTPTLRRNNTSPSPSRAGFTNSKSSRGKSLSPKLGPWGEPYLPEFSAEPPPNLRTTLSDRTFQRGGGPYAISRDGATARTRGAFSDTPLQQWHAVSPEGPGSSLRNANDYNRSQTSRASVVSSCDDDVEMAESALSASTRTSTGSGSRATNVSSTNRENPSPKRCILPAKRQMRLVGANGDTPPIFAVAARKSYERQVAQRRSPQAMFRPLLSSVPMTSFYTGRPGGMHLQSSIPLADSPATMNGTPHTSVGIHGGLASNIFIYQRSDAIIDGSNVQTSVEEECGAICVGEEAKTLGDGLELSATNKKGDGLMEIIDQVPMKEVEDGDERDDHHNISMAEKMDEVGCLKGENVQRENNSVVSITDALAPAHSPAEYGEECISILEGNKIKGHQVEEQRLVKTQYYAGMTTYTGSPHGSHTLVAEFGSFRRQSPMKASTPRSHDGSVAVEKATSCDSFTTDSYGLDRSLASALSNCEPMQAPMVRSPRDGMDTSFCDESCADLERDMMSIDGLADSSNSSTSLRHECQHELLKDDATAKDSISEPSTLQVEDSLFVEKLDKLSKQDVLSIIGSCASKIISGHDDAIEHVVKEEAGPVGLGRSIDALCMNSRGVLEFSEEDDTSQKPQIALSPLTRSITLHEATDTILFCSSIIHELVYKAATLAIQDEEEKETSAMSSRSDFIARFGLSGVDEHKASRGKGPNSRTRKRQPLGDSAVCERSSYVQKQRMVHRQTPAITMRQSPMDRTENAVMGNNEEMEILPKVRRVVPKKKTTTKQARRVQCRCSCCLM